MAYSDSIKLNMSSPEEIGKAIQKRRRAQKITQKEFAQRLGKSERTIQKYESGEILMKIDVVKQIANELNVPWQELLSSEDTNVSDNNTTSEYPACEFNTMSDVINALFAITELTDFHLNLLTLNRLKALNGLLVSVLMVRAVENMMQISVSLWKAG